jgi:hypothetical protein
MSLLDTQYDEMSYENLKDLRGNFKKILPDAFRKYDEPGFFFWKPVFYFYNGTDSTYGLGNAGLLHPSWNKEDEYVEIKDNSNQDNGKALKDVSNIDRDIKIPNSAYNYLLRNAEQKRAALLMDFIILLSEISSKTPWYFKEVSGLDEALSRSAFYKSPKIDEERKKIVITCLADSVDTRIGNMLDMYRAACFSWQTRREIVPANLRKFDMGIYIYLQPTQRNLHKGIKKVSHKYLEFHNCEIDIDSCKMDDSFSAETPKQMEYKITISYDHCFDNRYSNSVVGLIGDAIMTDFITGDTLDTDTNNLTLSTEDRFDFDGDIKYGEMYNPSLVLEEYNKSSKEKSELAEEKINIYTGVYTPDKKVSSGFLSGLINNAVDTTVGTAMQAARNTVGGLLLGNLYHGSLLSGLRRFGQGNVISGGKEVFDAVTDMEGHKNALKNGLGSFKSTLDKLPQPKNNNKTTTKLGNLNKNKSIINNI